MRRFPAEPVAESVPPGLNKRASAPDQGQPLLGSPLSEQHSVYLEQLGQLQPKLLDPPRARSLPRQELRRAHR